MSTSSLFSFNITCLFCVFCIFPDCFLVWVWHVCVCAGVHTAVYGVQRLMFNSPLYHSLLLFFETRSLSEPEASLFLGSLHNEIRLQPVSPPPPTMKSSFLIWVLEIWTHAFMFVWWTLYQQPFIRQNLHIYILFRLFVNILKNDLELIRFV